MSVRLSSRVLRDLTPNLLTERLLGRRRRGLPVLDLTVSNPTRCRLAYPEPELRAILGGSAWMTYEPSPLGRLDSRQAVAAYYAARGAEVPPGRILLTASTSEAYAYILKLLTEPGDRILVPRPSYPLFELLADMESVALARYELHYHGEWSVDLSSVEAELTPRTRVLVLVHPNNPTGSFLRAGELRELGRLCRERGVCLIGDEVFADYAFGSTAPPSLVPGPEGVLSFTLNGLSKILAMPQLKLGWMVLGGPDQLVAPALEALELIADTYLSVGTPVQASLPRLLELRDTIQAAVLGRLRTNVEALGRLLAAQGPCSALPVQGGWSAVLRVPSTRGSEAWAVDLLDRTGVLVHPGRFYDFRTEAFLVVSLLGPPDEFVLGMERLLDFCSAAC